jgi:hypothetical protein
MWLIVSGILLLVAGFAMLFAVTTNLIEGGAGVAMLAFVLTLVGLVTGLCGIARYLAICRRRRN